LRLEPTGAHHAPLVYEQMTDSRLWTFFPAMRPKSIEELRALYRRWERGNPYANRDEEWENWICFLRDTETPVGGMQATILPGSAAYIAYVMYVDHQRNGFAREAAQAVIDHLRQRHQVTRFIAEMNTKNEASIKLVESLGFKRVEERLDVERGHGIDADEYVYELLVPG
jgi:ribosomal-protein-alanine N-acetyltransferase